MCESLTASISLLSRWLARNKRNPVRRSRISTTRRPRCHVGPPITPRPRKTTTTRRLMKVTDPHLWFMWHPPSGRLMNFSYRGARHPGTDRRNAGHLAGPDGRLGRIDSVVDHQRPSGNAFGVGHTIGSVDRAMHRSISVHRKRKRTMWSVHCIHFVGQLNATGPEC